MATPPAGTEANETVSGLVSLGRRLLGSGEEASLESEVLLSHVLGKSREWLYAHSEEFPAESKRRIFLELVEERSETGCPVAYLTGCKEFHGLLLAMARGVLIPRPETEDLVDFAMRQLERAGKGKAATVVDAGCGCGAIGITLAAKAGANVIAVDISKEAVELTAANAVSCNVGDRIRVLRGSWLDPLSSLGPDLRVDAVISNPPYVPTARISSLPRDIRLHEPRTALDGGRDGLDSIRELAEQARDRLSSSGFLAFEFGEDQEEPVVEILRRGGWRGIEIAKDMAGKPRIALARR